MSMATGYGMKPTGARGAGPGDIVPKGYRAGQLQQFTPEQMNLFSSLFGHVGPQSYLSRLAGGDEAAFAQAEGPALRQFNELQGNIASRFSGMGSGGRHSSGFQNTLTSAASNFAQQLQAQRHDLQRQALSDLLGISESLLSQKPYDRFIQEKRQKQSSSSGWGGLIGAGLGGLGGFFAGGPGGALAGASLGQRLGSAF